jgi:hypothetical protein
LTSARTSCVGGRIEVRVDHAPGVVAHRKNRNQRDAGLVRSAGAGLDREYRQRRRGPIPDHAAREQRDAVLAAVVVQETWRKGAVVLRGLRELRHLIDFPGAAGAAVYFLEQHEVRFLVLDERRDAIEIRFAGCVLARVHVQHENADRIGRARRRPGEHACGDYDRDGARESRIAHTAVLYKTCIAGAHVTGGEMMRSGPRART